MAHKHDSCEPCVEDLSNLDWIEYDFNGRCVKIVAPLERKTVCKCGLVFHVVTNAKGSQELPGPGAYGCVIRTPEPCAA